MNTIKLNTIGERPIKKGGASGGGSPIEFDVSEYFANYTRRIPITDEFIQAVMDFNVIFTRRESNTEGDWSWTVTERCIIMTLRIEDAETPETGERDHIIAINDGHNDIFGVQTGIDLINKELKFYFPA